MIKNLSPNAGVSRAGGYGVISPECREPVQEVVESVVYIGKAHLPDPGSPSRTIKAADVKASGYRKLDMHGYDTRGSFRTSCG